MLLKIDYEATNFKVLIFFSKFINNNVIQKKILDGFTKFFSYFKVKLLRIYKQTIAWSIVQAIVCIIGRL